MIEQKQNQEKIKSDNKSDNKQEHYFTENPTSELVLFKNEFIIKRIHKQIPFYSASGVFGIKKVDLGSELLINKAQIKPKQKILDLGCGYGIIGVAIKLIEPTAEITFSDINNRALDITKKNLQLNNLQGKVIHSDGFNNIQENNIKEKFDVILLNPPQTAGKDLCLKLIRESKDHLNKKGSLQLVARHKKGGETLALYMKEVFNNIKELGKGSGFRVYYSELK